MPEHNKLHPTASFKKRYLFPDKTFIRTKMQTLKLMLFNYQSFIFIWMFLIYVFFFKDFSLLLYVLLILTISTIIDRFRLLLFICHIRPGYSISMNKILISLGISNTFWNIFLFCSLHIRFQNYTNPALLNLKALCDIIDTIFSVVFLLCILIRIII